MLLGLRSIGTIVDGDLIARRMSQPYHTDLSIVFEDSEVMPLRASLWYILIAFYCGTCEDFAAFPVLLSDFARYESPKPEISWRFQECGILLD